MHTAPLINTFMVLSSPNALPLQAEREFRQHVMAEWPREAVGIIRHEKYQPLYNLADDPEWDFRVKAEQIVEATHLLHSHTRSELKHPSLADIHLGRAYPDLIMCLTTCDGTNTGEIVQWGRNAPIADYEGRRFLFFIRDCASLVTDWYRRELKLDIPDWPRTPYWWEEGQDLFRDALTACGFTQVEQPQVGHCMLTRLGRQPVPVHGGIVVSPTGFLHHPQGSEMSETRLSRIDSLQQWQRFKHSYWRPPVGAK